MARNAASIVVVGSGVSGLTTALCLSESGESVRIVADRPPLQTTSAVAGAVWGPYVSADPRVLEWSLKSLPDFEAIAAEHGSGVRLGRGVEAAREALEAPAWITTLQGFALCSSNDLPAGFDFGWSYITALIDMPRYLDYLVGRLSQRGVQVDIIDSPVRSLRELALGNQVVVNCTGLGAKGLVPDPAMKGGWGQLVVVENPGIEGFFSDLPETEEQTYLIAHADHVILGGVVSFERSDTKPDPQVSNRILERCTAIEPRLQGCRILGYRVGLRPVRPLVRLEREDCDGAVIVHNYGHGGSGVTLSWECARQVRALIA